jgi:hypothetical protein
VLTLLRRDGRQRLPPVQPRGPVVRYEHAVPGALVNLGIKKLAKIGRVGLRVHGDRTTRVAGIG